MKKNKKETSPRVASIAGKVLQDEKSSKTAKTLAGSDLSQTRKKKEKGKS
jgi:hypothetical protein